MATMLSHQGQASGKASGEKEIIKRGVLSVLCRGRSFSFNRSADGYQRGEGYTFTGRAFTFARVHCMCSSYVQSAAESN